MASIPAVGTRWRRKPPGSQTVRVTRVWYHRGRWTVAAVPLNGGPAVVMDADRFTLEQFRHAPGNPNRP